MGREEGRNVGGQEDRIAERKESRKAGRQEGRKASFSLVRHTARSCSPSALLRFAAEAAPTRRPRAVWRSLPRPTSLHIYQNTVSRQRAACSAAEVELRRVGMPAQKWLLSCSPCGLHRAEFHKAAPRFRGAPSRTEPPPRGNVLELRALPLKRPRQAPSGGWRKRNQ